MPGQKTYLGIRNISTAFNYPSKILTTMTSCCPRASRAMLAISEGECCSFKIKYLSPLQAVAEAFVNPEKDQKLKDLVAASHDVTWKKGKN